MGDNCSDVELRRRLREEFNFICGPVTDTTRSIYLKKLDNFIKERNKETNARRLKHDSNDANGNSSFLSPVRSSPRNSARRTDFENGRLTPEIAESGRKSRASPNRSPKKSRRTEAAAETSISPRRRTATTLTTIAINTD
ncbi:hypothetical protein B4U80_03231 [Leptotrombidium deliense]|uniref:LEM domain-containing protein n=1 Tax=Leptotrombidium deliense TaxID=299467 RepID=A0A443RVP4_9ACAR|nr:hypothetical protein B4U80_03231 [Leptotrombidium deliense]